MLFDCDRSVTHQYFLRASRACPAGARPWHTRAGVSLNLNPGDVGLSLSPVTLELESAPTRNWTGGVGLVPQACCFGVLVPVATHEILRATWTCPSRPLFCRTKARQQA